MSIRTVSSREVYRNRWMRIREDAIERDGVPGIYGVVEKTPSCIVVPLESTPEGDVVWLVRQFRYTVGGTYFELPQGSWELDPAADGEELARAELREETGMRAGSMTLLSSMWIAYGVLRQVQHVFLARDLMPGETDRDPEEDDMTVHRVPVREFETMLLDGRIMDNCTAAAWGVYRVWRERQTKVNQD